MSEIAGWDIGGVNTKAARLTGAGAIAVAARPFELQRAPDRLVPLLRALAAELALSNDAVHAVTMTAELSQMFRTKREGVAFVLAAVEEAFPAAPVHVYAVDGRFLSPEEARNQALAVAAGNWSATARAVGLEHSDALLVDVGTTTADVIPIANGEVVAVGRTDPERLVSGELVYSGALRTPVEAIASHVPLAEGLAGVAAEGFAVSGDVHVWRGELAQSDYTVPPPDGRTPSREDCGARLARAVCADPELVDETAITCIADAFAAAQIARIADAIHRVHARHPAIDLALVTGLGAFLAEAAARRAGLRVEHLAAEWGEATARYAPAASVARLLERSLVSRNANATAASVSDSRHESRVNRGIESVVASSSWSGNAGVVWGSSSSGRAVVASGFSRTEGAVGVSGFSRTEESVVDTVVKLGGGVFHDEAAFGAALEAIVAASRVSSLVLVPGGGPFADRVRELDRRHHFSDATAHWMAILAMDQYAHAIVDKLPGSTLVRDRSDITACLAAGRVPVLAPAAWLREADPLPHSWDVTSDSLAAWIAGALGARCLVLIKPPGARLDDAVDAHFARALPRRVKSIVVAADDLNSWIQAMPAGSR